MKQLGIKIIGVMIVTGMLVPVFPAKQAEAQFVVEFGPAATTLITAIATATASQALTTGAIGVGAVTVATARESLGSACLATIVSLDTADAVSTTLDATSSAALGVIGGGPAELTKISAKIATATTAKACVDTYVEILSRIPGATLETSAEVSREQDKYTKVSNSLRQKISDLSAQQNASVKDILKAFMVKVILNVSKNLTTEMVNKMVEKYKISDYMAYGDAVASQVYSMKYINENFSGDARQQMMIRSVLQSEKFPEKVKTVQSFANSKAQEYLGTACGVGTPGVSSDDQNYFLKCLAAYGAPESSPQYHYLTALDQAQATNAAAKASATAELSQSNGFAPPRSCGGSLAVQQQIDNQYETAYLEKDIAVATAARLKAALNSNPPKTTQAEYDKAQAAADQAIANVNALANNVVVGKDGKTSDSPIIDICEAIDSPAAFVSSSINSYLAKHFDESSQLKSENLPFYANFLADVASNFLNNILTGGKSTSQVFKEAGVGALNGAMIGISQQAQGNQVPTTVPNPVGDVEIYAQPVNGTALGARTTSLVAGQSYRIIINFSAIADEGLTRAVISGIGVDGGSRNLTLTAAEQSAKRLEFDYTSDALPFTLRATFYGPQPVGQVGEKQIGPYSQAFTASRVAGASIVLPRGPAAVPIR